MCTFTYSTWQVSCTSYMICVCVLLMLFSVCFGVTMFGEPWLRPPALWNQLRATRPRCKENYNEAHDIQVIHGIWTQKETQPKEPNKKTQRKPLQLTISTYLNGWNWRKKHIICRFFFRKQLGARPRICHSDPMPMQSWVVGFITWHLGGRIFPPILVVKSNGNLPNNARNHSGYSGFSGNRAVTAGSNDCPAVIDFHRFLRMIRDIFVAEFKKHVGHFEEIRKRHTQKE